MYPVNPLFSEGDVMVARNMKVKMKRAASSEIQPDVQEVASAIRLSHQAYFSKPLCEREVNNLTELLLNKPFYMPDYLRAWLKSDTSPHKPPYENDTITWLVQSISA